MEAKWSLTPTGWKNFGKTFPDTVEEYFASLRMSAEDLSSVAELEQLLSSAWSSKLDDHPEWLEDPKDSGEDPKDQEEVESTVTSADVQTSVALVGTKAPEQLNSNHLIDKETATQWLKSVQLHAKLVNQPWQDLIKSLIINKSGEAKPRFRNLYYYLTPDVELDEVGQLLAQLCEKHKEPTLLPVHLSTLVPQLCTWDAFTAHTGHLQQYASEISKEAAVIASKEGEVAKMVAELMPIFQRIRQKPVDNTNVTEERELVAALAPKMAERFARAIVLDGQRTLALDKCEPHIVKEKQKWETANQRQLPLLVGNITNDQCRLLSIKEDDKASRIEKSWRPVPDQNTPEKPDEEAKRGGRRPRKGAASEEGKERGWASDHYSSTIQASSETHPR